MNLVGGGVGDTIQSIEKDNIAASLSLAIPKSHIKSGLIHMMVSVCLFPLCGGALGRACSLPIRG